MMLIVFPCSEAPHLLRLDAISVLDERPQELVDEVPPGAVDHRLQDGVEELPHGGAGGNPVGDRGMEITPYWNKANAIPSFIMK